MKRPISSRTNPGFGLAFLDVLCCGLGSAVLLLLIVKQGPADADTIDQAYIDSQMRAVEERISAEASRRDELRKRLADQELALTRDAAVLRNLSTQQSEGAAQYARLLDQLGSERAALRENAARLRDLQTAADASPTKPEETEPEPYGRQLTGINIAEDRVAIFLDRSASMLHASLVEIVRLRVSSAALQRQAEKWTGARAAALWAFRQIPEGARFQFFTFSADLRDMDGETLQPSQSSAWLIKGERSLSAQVFNAAQAGIAPAGGTNLKQVFEVAARLVPKPRQVLILTDGYPTLPGNKRLSSLRGCPRAKRGVTPILSPECRRAIFVDAVNVVGNRLAGVPIDVILYPLDGDANAVRGYWLLTALSGGRLLTPVPGWPLAG